MIYKIWLYEKIKQNIVKKLRRYYKVTNLTSVDSHIALKIIRMTLVYPQVKPKIMLSLFMVLCRKSLVFGNIQNFANSYSIIMTTSRIIDELLNDAKTYNILHQTQDSYAWESSVAL